VLGANPPIERGRRQNVSLEGRFGDRSTQATPSSSTAWLEPPGGTPRRILIPGPSAIRPGSPIVPSRHHATPRHSTRPHSTRPHSTPRHATPDRRGQATPRGRPIPWAGGNAANRAASREERATDTHRGREIKPDARDRSAYLEPSPNRPFPEHVAYNHEHDPGNHEHVTNIRTTAPADWYGTSRDQKGFGATRDGPISSVTATRSSVTAGWPGPAGYRLAAQPDLHIP
jgi:hypothetical protein